jgi:hypothetical protein
MTPSHHIGNVKKKIFEQFEPRLPRSITTEALRLIEVRPKECHIFYVFTIAQGLKKRRTRTRHATAMALTIKSYKVLAGAEKGL